MTRPDFKGLKNLYKKVTKGKWLLVDCPDKDCWCSIIDVESKDPLDFVAASGCLNTQDASFFVAVKESFKGILSYVESLEQKVKNADKLKYQLEVTEKALQKCKDQRDHFIDELGLSENAHNTLIADENSRLLKIINGGK